MQRRAPDLESLCQSAMDHAPSRSRGAITHSRSTFMLIALALSVSCLFSSTGCIRSIANLLYVIKGRDRPAEFDQLKEKTVAVIVSTPSGFNSDASSIIMTRNVSELLASNVKKIKVVPQEEVDRVLSDMPISMENASKIGSRVHADYVVYVELSNLKFKDGATLYRGRCETELSVYQTSEGDRPVFKKHFKEFVYPGVGAPVADFNEAEFQRTYLSVLASHITRTFYPFDPGTDVALDASFLGYSTSN